MVSTEKVTYHCQFRFNSRTGLNFNQLEHVVQYKYRVCIYSCIYFFSYIVFFKYLKKCFIISQVILNLIMIIKHGPTIESEPVSNFKIFLDFTLQTEQAKDKYNDRLIKL